MRKHKKQTFEQYWNSMPKERLSGVEYRQVKDLDGNMYPYVVSNTGIVRNMENNRVLKPYSNGGYGYKVVDLFYPDKDGTSCRKKMTIHRMVMIAFGKLTDKDMVINHKSMDPSDNSLDNLEVCTTRENVKYSYDRNRMKVPICGDEDALKTAINVCKYLSIGGMTFDEIAKICGCSKQYVVQIYNGKKRRSLAAKYKFKPRKYFEVSTETAGKVCQLLELNEGLTNQEIADRAGTIPKFVDGIAQGGYRKDISHNRGLLHNEIPKESLYTDELVKPMLYNGIEFNVFITTYGRVFNSAGIEVKPYVNLDGFLTVNVKELANNYNVPIQIHKAVASTFIPHDPKLNYVGFKDLDYRNCHVDNLIWMTETERRGMMAKKPKYALTLKKAKKACKLIADGLDNTTIAKMVGLSRYMVQSIRAKCIIRWISDEYFTDGITHISKSGHAMTGNKRFSDDDLMDMMKLKNRGYKSSEIAKKYDTSKEYVNKLWKGELNPRIKERFDKDRPLVILLGKHTKSKNVITKSTLKIKLGTKW